MPRSVIAIELAEQAAPGIPGAGLVALYAKADGKVYCKDDAGVEYDLTGGPVTAGDVTPGLFQASTSFRFPSLQVGDAANAAPVAGYLQTAGTLSGIRMEDRAGTGNPDWVIYPSGGQLTIWTGGMGAQGNRLSILPSGLIRAGTGLDGAYIGEHPVHNAYAGFGHVALENVTADYCLLQHSNGTTILNSSAATSVSLRVGGSTKVSVTGSTVTSNVRLDVTGGIHATNDWFRISGNGGIHWETHGGGWFMSDTTWLRTYSNKSVYSGSGVFLTANTGRAFHANNAGAYAEIGKAFCGTWRGSATWAVFGHILIANGLATYGFMHADNGRILINSSGPDNSIDFFNNGTFHMMELRDVSGVLDWRGHGLPAIAGVVVRRNATSNQIGPESSTKRVKKDIRPLPETGSANPLWKLQTRRFAWDETKVANGREENERLPGGIAGLIAEEVAEWAPDAIHVDAEGQPVAVEHTALIGYLVDAVQYIERRLAQIERLPAVGVGTGGN